MKDLKGKNQFTSAEIKKLEVLITQRINTPSSSQKSIRQKMRNIGFYGQDDWGITDLQTSDLHSLIKTGKIKVTDGIVKATVVLNIKEKPMKFTSKKVQNESNQIVTKIDSNPDSRLMRLDKFIPLKNFDLKTLDFKGLYILRVKNISNLSTLFKHEIITNKGNIIYTGKGERTIFERLEEECLGKGNGTFFRGIGALLNFRPTIGSLVGKMNKKNYKFIQEDKEKIIEWMFENLELSFIQTDENIDSTEKELIKEYCPILNTVHNPQKSKLLADLRKECRQIALSTKK